jgi:protein-S-isoprenylcysteine O-methyltransferase Ste14
MNLQNIGTKVFRYRGQIPALVLLLILPVICYFPCPISPVFTDLYAVNILAFAFIFAGVSYRTYSVGFRFDHSSGRNRHQQVAQQLNTTESYSMSQHPIYFSNGLLWVGILLVMDSYWVLVLGLCYYLGFTFLMIRTETAFLLETFGDAYHQWKKRTSSVFPNPLKYKRGVTGFNWMRVFATEYPSWLSIIASVLTLHILKNSMNNKNFTFTKADFMLIATGLLIGFGGRFYKYVVVRKWLKKSI